jgi:oxysterol-binding protein-related protein 8
LNRKLKKPFNPIIGEVFRCYWNYLDGSKAYCISEQVSHHPPISCFLYCNITHGVYISGEFKPKPTFMGNSIMVCLNGSTTIKFRKRPEEIYRISYPNLFARGLFFGDPFVEISGKSTISCEFLNQIAAIEFNSEGYFNKERDVLSGEIKNEENTIKIEGKWSKEIMFSGSGSTVSKIVNIEIFSI